MAVGGKVTGGLAVGIPDRWDDKDDSQKSGKPASTSANLKEDTGGPAPSDKDDGHSCVFMTTEAGISPDLLEGDPLELASELEISSGEVFAIETSSYTIDSNLKMAPPEFGAHGIWCTHGC